MAAFATMLYILQEMKRVTELLYAIIQKIVKPIECELPYFVITFLMWSLNTLLDIKAALCNMSFAHFSDSFQYLGITFFYSYLLTCIVYLLKNRWIKIFLYFISLIIVFIIFALRKIFQTTITPDIMQLLAETNEGEACEFINNYALSHGSIVAMVIVAILIFAITVWEHYYHRKNHKFNYPFTTSLFAILLIFSLASVSLYVKLFSCHNTNQIEQFIVEENDRGMDNLTSILYSAHTLNLAIADSRNIIDATLHELNHGNAHCINTDTLDLILVIGESYNKLHAGIYGYPLNTTPCLQKEMDNGNLIVFKDVISPYNTTSRTLKHVMSVGEQNSDQSLPLLVSTFQRAEYDIAWWDNQLGLENHKDIFSFSLNSLLFNSKIKDVCYNYRNNSSFCLDGDLIDNFTSSNSINKSTRPKHLIVFHLMGQHLMAKYRYPNDKAHCHFTADSVIIKASYIDDNANKDIAHYDNATLYNDEIMGRIIELYRNENSIVIYFSDHGEEVYDYRYSIGRKHSEHKSPAFLNSQNDIPFMIWCSDKYIHSHPDVISRLRNAVNTPFMNTDLAQILFDLGEIDTPYRTNHLNPISEDFKPHARIVYDKIDYDQVVKRK